MSYIETRRYADRSPPPCLAAVSPVRGIFETAPVRQTGEVTRQSQRWGETAHVFLGAGLALPPAFLAFAFGLALISHGGGILGRAPLLVLLALTVAVIVTVALLPQVRPVEIGVARALLHLDLPEPSVTTALGPRLLGLAWCAIVALVGGLCMVAIMWLVPLGVGLIAVPFSVVRLVTMPLPGQPTWQITSGWASAGVALLGLLAIVLSYAVTRVAGRILTWAAPTFLGPTDADRAVDAIRRERRVAEANHMARELHDSIGHALTAMTIQARAGLAALERSPDATRAALMAIDEVGARAVGDLDAMLGTLRGARAAGGAGAAGERADDANEIVAVPEPDHVAHIASELLANAMQHGTGAVELRIERGDPIEVTCINPIAEGRAGAGVGGYGLTGLRERVALLGGSLTAGPDDDGHWSAHATLPAPENS